MSIVLELAKARRCHILSLTLTIVAVTVLWCAAAIGKQFANPEIIGSPATIIDHYPKIMIIVLPLVVAIIVARLTTIEHDHNMLARLFTAGQNMRSLFWAKLSLILVISALVLTIGLFGVLVIGKFQGVAIDLKLSLWTLLLLVLVAAELAAPLLVLGLRTDHQGVVLGLGLGLAVIGALLQLAPLPIQFLFPNTQIAAASPTSWVLNAQNYVIGYVENPAGIARIPLVAVIAVAVVVISAIWHTKKEIEL